MNFTGKREKSTEKWVDRKHRMNSTSKNTKRIIMKAFINLFKDFINPQTNSSSWTMKLFFLFCSPRWLLGVWIGMRWVGINISFWPHERIEIWWRFKKYSKKTRNISFFRIFFMAFSSSLIGFALFYFSNWNKNSSTPQKKVVVVIRKLWRLHCTIRKPRPELG